MQSKQETVLEEFMQRSFGAQFLYVPSKYQKGTGYREPADLAWIGPDLTALFYLTSSSADLDQQISHNLKQANGYHRLWATKKLAYALRGTNRFGDSCFEPYSKLKNLLTILVVSSKCGVRVWSEADESIPNAFLVVPELLFHWISVFGGTVVDLLQIISLYIEIELDNANSEYEFALLAEVVDDYIRDSFLKADPDRAVLRHVPAADYHVMYAYLFRMKLSAVAHGGT